MEWWRRNTKKTLSTERDRFKDISGMGPIHFVWKPLMLDLNWIDFWLGPLYKVSKSSVYLDLRWVLRILEPIQIFRGPMRIWKGPSKFQILHVFEWDIDFKGATNIPVGLCKQCRPRSDAAECGVWSGSIPFAIHTAIFFTHQGLVEWTILNFRTSMVSSKSVPIFRVNTVRKNITTFWLEILTRALCTFYLFVLSNWIWPPLSII